MLFPTKGVRRQRDELPIFQATAGIYNNNNSRQYHNYSDGRKIMNDEPPIYTIANVLSDAAKREFDADEFDNRLDGDDNNYNTTHRSGDDRQQHKQHPLLRIIMIFILLLCSTIMVQRTGDGSEGGPAQILINMPLELMSSVLPKSVTLILGDRVGAMSDDSDKDEADGEEDVEGPRPDFVYEHPYVSSSYYTSTKSIKTLLATQNQQVVRNLRREAEEAAGMHSSSQENDEIKTRLAIVRPFCEFDAEALPTTFTCWNALPPCKAAAGDIGDDDEDEDSLFEVESMGELYSYNTNSTAGRTLYDQASDDRYMFDLVGSDAMKSANADVFLFYSQTFSENEVAIKAVDAIIDQFFEPGGWSQCFGNIYAIEANIPQELDLYIPSAQEELYSWVNGPNRQFEAAFRIIQSGEWGEYDGFYLMEGDSVPVKAHWLDVVLSEIEDHRPFAILGE